MKSSNTISVSFDKSDFKDLLIIEMVKYYEENCEYYQVIDSFLDSNINFVRDTKTYRQ